MNLPEPAPPALPRPPGIGGALGMIVLYFLLQAGIGAALFLLYLVVPNRLGLDRTTLQTLAPILVAPAAVVLIAHAVHRRWPWLWRQADPPGFGLAGRGTAPYYALALLFGLSLPLIGAWITQWLAHGLAVHQDVKELGDEAAPALRPLLALVVTAVGPFAEELLFRGVLLSALLQRMRAGWAIACSALLFGLVHLPNFGFVWYAIPSLALLGMALSWLRLRSGSLWPAILAHAANNLLAVMAWFLAG